MVRYEIRNWILKVQAHFLSEKQWGVKKWEQDLQMRLFRCILWQILTSLAPSGRSLSTKTPLPSYLRFLITPKPVIVSKYNLRSSSDSTLLSYPNVKPKATLGERAFLFAAPKLWNAVPRFIRESISVDTFKRKLKTHLFKKAFCTT